MLADFARVCGAAVIIFCLTGRGNFASAQAERTATPIVASLVTPTPAGLSVLAPTVTATPTATAQGPAQLQARESAGRVNLRLEPDTDSDLLGTISYGTLYPMLRRYYLWFELSYELAPNGRAWVFSELVEVEGDLDAVPVITDYPEITNVTDSAAQAGSGAGSGDSAGAGDAATESRILLIPPTADERRRGESEAVASPLPTFTYPPDIPAFSENAWEAARENEPQATGAGGLADLPPLFPIVVLAGSGIVGLMISFIRR